MRVKTNCLLRANSYACIYLHTSTTNWAMALLGALRYAVYASGTGRRSCLRRSYKTGDHDLPLAYPFLRGKKPSTRILG